MNPGSQRLDWDYSQLADAYVHRPDYADGAIDAIVSHTGLGRGTRALDLGAGTGKLTLKLAERGWDVLALEPNAAMRAHGKEHTRGFPGLRWIDGVMERTGQPDCSFAICTCGSSFGVVDRMLTLREVARVLRDGGWFACVFNHRDLEDPLQREIEALIRTRIPEYSYGTRREEQSAVIDASGLFEPAVRLEGRIDHRLPAAQWVEAWRSHATLQRQAGSRFGAIVDEIAAIVARRGNDPVTVPYVTRAWIARLKRS